MRRTLTPASSPVSSPSKHGDRFIPSRAGANWSVNFHRINVSGPQGREAARVHLACCPSLLLLDKQDTCHSLSSPRRKTTSLPARTAKPRTPPQTAAKVGPRPPIRPPARLPLPALASLCALPADGLAYSALLKNELLGAGIEKVQDPQTEDRRLQPSTPEKKGLFTVSCAGPPSRQARCWVLRCSQAEDPAGGLQEGCTVSLASGSFPTPVPSIVPNTWVSGTPPGGQAGLRVPPATPCR